MAPLTPMENAELDQVRSTLVDHFPMLWRGMYTNMVKEGFTEEQAMDLLKTYVASSSAPSS